VTERKVPNGKGLVTDPAARSSEVGLPAFLARPSGTPVYYGFPLVEETRTNGWCYGAITQFEEARGCEAGDGFVVAPDGSRAGLVWSVGTFPTEAICEPDGGRWGVYSIAFPQPVRNVDDIVACFRAVLPELKAIHARVRGGSG
jgi:hypothetical protein